MARFLSLSLSLAVVGGAAALGAGPPEELFAYLDEIREEARWEVGTPRSYGTGEHLDIRLHSQTWRGIPWEHELLLCTPAEPVEEDVMVLFISGDANPGDAVLGLSLAARAGLRVAILSDVPVQPLFGGLREDALIAYTFQRYLAEGDPNWPLLFPMTGAAVAAMDALKMVAAGLWGVDLRGFVVTGASKRGWTTYLAAAAAPDRVLGMAPLVFDILNIPLQLSHQREFWGGLSPMIHDYSARGLTEAFESDPAGTRLAWLVDPYSYRYAYTMPKLIVLGSNDPYWPVDALNLYWHGLPDPKAVLVVPNSGHGLEDRTRVLDSLGAFSRAVAAGTPLPRLSFSFSPGERGLRVSLSSDTSPTEAWLWTAESPHRDFRDAHWARAALTPTEAGWEAFLPRPEAGYLAAFAELVFPLEGGPLHLTTPARVVGP